MRILLDECLPRKLLSLLEGHESQTVPQAGWAGIKNGQLLKLAQDKFDVFLTVDQHLPEQQNVQTLHIGIIVVVSKSNRLKDLLPHLPEILKVLAQGRFTGAKFVGR